MWGVADFGAFVLAFIVLLIIPGPGNFMLLTAIGKGGVRGGLAAIVGVIFGDQVLLWLAVAGVSALLATHPSAFHVVQWLGAAYLAFLGWKLLRSKPGSGPLINIAPRQYARQAFVITLLNPKAIMFYMAFFPLFVDPKTHLGLPTFAFMAACIAVMTLLYGIITIALVHTLAERLRANPRITQRLEQLAGVGLIGFGIKLAISR